MKRPTGFWRFWRRRRVHAASIAERLLLKLEIGSNKSKRLIIDWVELVEERTKTTVDR